MSVKYLPHILLAYLAIGLQRGLGDLLSVGDARLDVVWLVALFYALSIPRAGGALAAVLVGLAYDLTGAGPIGWHAASLGLAGFAIGFLPTNRWGRLAASLAAGVVVAGIIAWILNGLRSLFGGAPAQFGFGGMLGTMLLTGVFALPLSLPLWKWKRVFAIEPDRF